MSDWQPIDKGDHYEDNAFTHWMPLPAPPVRPDQTGDEK